MSEENTSLVEINITQFGIWLCLKDKEYFLSYEDYPFFQEAILKDVYNIELHHESHLYWPELDIDLNIEILQNPHRYPLIARK